MARQLSILRALLFEALCSFTLDSTARPHPVMEWMRMSRMAIGYWRYAAKRNHRKPWWGEDQLLEDKLQLHEHCHDANTRETIDLYSIKTTISFLEIP